jgi:hypothetical protein
VVGSCQRVQTPFQNTALYVHYPIQLGLIIPVVAIGVTCILERLDYIVLGPAQHVILPGILMPRIHFYYWYILQYLQSPFPCFGFLPLDVLDDLVVDFVLAAVAIIIIIWAVTIIGS